MKTKNRQKSVEHVTAELKAQIKRHKWETPSALDVVKTKECTLVLTYFTVKEEFLTDISNINIRVTIFR
jgi:hypothetical protein